MSQNTYTKEQLANLSAEEKRKILLQMMQEKKRREQVAQQRALTDRLTEHARQFPEDIALQSTAQSFSYQQVCERIAQYASGLRRAGCEGKRVAVVLADPFEEVCLLLALVQVNAVLIPLSLSDSEEYRYHVLKQCDAEWVITEKRGLPESLQQRSPAEILQYQKDEERADAPATMDLDATTLIRLDGEAPFYESYALSLKMLDQLIEVCGFTRQERVICSTGGVGVFWEKLALLSSGATWVVNQENAHEVSDSDTFPVWIGTSGTFYRLLPTPSFSRPLKRIILINVLPVQKVLAELSRSCQCPVVSLLCLPRAGGVLAVSASDLPPTAGKVLIGKGVNETLHVVDPHLQPVPDGSVGVLCVAVSGRLARQLKLQNPANRYVKNPHSRQPEDALYLPGFQVKRGADGVIELLALTERHAYPNGDRVDLARVEALLMQDTSIHQAWVIDYVQPSGRREWAAWVVANRNFSSERVISRLMSVLPCTAVPGSLIPVAYLPLDSRGAVDEKRLGDVSAVTQETVRRLDEKLKQLADPDGRQTVRVTAAAALPVVETQPRAHLTDFLPERIHGSSRAVEAEPVEREAHVDSIASPMDSSARSVAEVHGVALPDLEHRSLPDLLLNAAQAHPENGIHFVRSDGSRRFISYLDLKTRAQRVLSGLRKAGLQAGDRVIFQFQHNDDFVVAFWGCQLAGIVPIPLAPLKGTQIESAEVTKLASVWSGFEKPVVLTSQSQSAHLYAVAKTKGMEAFRLLEIETLLTEEVDTDAHHANPDDLAILLLTSGSTGLPKGVMQTHAAILSRTRAVELENGHSVKDVSLNWMPLDHVGGIVMYHVRDVYLQCIQIQVQTDYILGNPLSWLDLIEEFRVTDTWAPNFAYALINDCAKVIRERSWDLSSMRFILNAGESIVAKTARRFLKLLERHKLAQDCMKPCWGMSETCSGVIYTTLDLDQTQDSDPYVVVGKPVPGFAIRVVDDRDHLVSEGVIGALQVKGPSVLRGYFNHPEQNRDAFTEDGWFRVGDLARISHGQLTITGREKDIIIINGINYASHEIETVCEELEGVEVSYTAACAVRRPDSDTDELAIFFHTACQDDTALKLLLGKIRERLMQVAGVAPSYFIPMEKSEIPKTEIGKIQRTLLSQRFAIGVFDTQLRRVDLLTENHNTLPSWFYERVWQPCLPNPFSGSLSRSRYLVFVDRSGLAQECIRRLEDSSHAVVRVESGQEYAHHDANHFSIRPAMEVDYQHLFEQIRADSERITHILYCWSFDPLSPELADAASFIASAQGVMDPVLLTLRAVARLASENEPDQFLIVTRNMIDVYGKGEGEVGLSFLPGLIRSAGSEFSQMACRFVDLSHASILRAVEHIWLEMLAVDAEDVVWRGAERMVSRFREIPGLSAESNHSSFHAQGTWMITGGLGGVGLALARWLLSQYAARVVLVDRYSPERLKAGGELSLERLTEFESLADLPGEVIYLQADCANYDQVYQAVSAGMHHFGKPFDGVFHLAGRYGEGVIAETPVAEFHALCESKCVGGFTLDKVFREIGQSSSDSLAPLLFINFSSLVALFGGATIAAYAASNSFLEGFTHYQNSLPSHGRSIRSVCLVSSNWNDTGMSQGYQMKSLSRERGFHFMTPEQGIVSVKAMVESGKSVSVFGLNPYKPAVRPYLIGGTLQSQALYGFYQMNAFSDSSLADLERIDLRDALDKRCSIDYVPVPSIPLTDEGEVNFVSLQEMVSGQLMGHKPKVAPRNTTETRIAEICARVLQLEEVGVKDNFFDIGANSMLIARIHNEIQNSLAIQFPMIELFNSTTIEKLAGFVDAMQTGVPDEGLEAARKMGEKRRESRLKHAFEGAEADAIDDAVAIIGLAGRLPMSDNMDQLWENLIGGKDCITRFTPEQLLELGVDPEMIARPDYVPAAGYIWNQDKFDALFFEINPKEAAGIDPQHRMGLEVAWEALEDSGYTSQSVKGDIGVFAGVNISHYLFEVLNASQPGSANAMELLIGGDKDHFGSRIAYKFDLRGPCVSMGTACSTTLVTTHFACQSLMAHECRLALTGGAHLFLPNGIGHVYHEGSYASSDTYCRPFDARSNGIIISNGVCFAVLKRLKDAIEDRDSIYAVIKGTAINNDGMDKIGYTAPSVSGQTRMIVDALTASQIPPESIRFVEAHGTGTQLGDPIEVSALTRAYRMQTDKVGYCGLGSIKSNMGHVGAVAGIAGMAKAALALKHRLLPPTIHFETPNPKLELDTSPFYVVAQAEPLERGAYPLRAAVSALGIGGTNAHVILEEPPEEVVSSESRDWQLLLLSAKNPASLDRMTENLSEWLTRHPQSNLADVAYTLQVGRVPFACKRGFVVQKGDMQAIASEIAPAKGFSGRSTEPPRQVVFMFPGGGTQYVLMAKGVYDSEPSFAQDMDRCAELIQHASGLDLFSLIYPQAGQMEEAEQRLQIPKHFFVALFAVEYSLARLWMSWGVKPTAVVGHSLGEYIAATIAGVFSLEEAIALVCFRGELFEKLEKGQMFSVTASAEAVSEWLIEGVSIATINNDQQCVVAGRFEPMEVFAEKLTRQGIEFRKLPIDTAGHSPMVDPILEEFGQFLSGITFHQPDIPLISNMSGEWVQSQEITTPDYWKRHLRQTVRFVDGVKTLLNEPNTLFLEVGAGRTLSSFVRAQLTPASRVSLFSSLRHAQDDRADMSHLLETLGKIWMTGKEIDWQALYMDERRQRISLPTYAFDRRRYWIEAKSPVSARQQERLPIDQWLWQPVWQLQERPATDHAEKSLDPVLLFSDGGGLCHALSDLLKQAGSQVVAVEKGSQFSTQSGGTMTIHPTTLKDYHALVSSLKQNARFPSTLVYAWSLETSQEDEVNQVNSLLALVYLAKALVARESEEPVRIVVLTCQREAVMPNDSLVCAQSLITGPVNVIPFEHPSIRILTLDLHASDVDDPAMARTVSEELYRYQQLTDEEWVGTPNALAIRSGARFVRDYTRLPTSSRAADEVAIAAQSVWVVTGGLGGVGMVHAQTLAPFGVKIALLQRSSFPDPDHWDAILKTESDGTLEQALMKNRIETLKRIQEQGSEVCIFKGDINQPENLRRCLQEVRATFGPITGVMHCAGFGDHVSTLETTPAILASVLAPKVTGTNRLLEMLHEDPLDYVVLCSSMSVQTTGYGLVGYIGACAYLDAVAHQHRKNRQTRFVSVNWDIWDTEQRGIRRKLDPAITTQAKEDRPLVRPHEGADILLRALVAHTPQVVVATANLHDILIKNRKIGTLLAQREDSVEQEGDQSDRENSGFFERPTLSSDYAAPETEAETILVAIWQEAFGVAPIGIHDNFFELGGESLLGVKIIASARQKGLVIDPKKMFTHPTIAQVVSGLSLSQPVQSQHQTVSGSYPCSPVQLDFLERKWVNPVHWNVGVMLPLDRHLSDEAMSSLVSTLLERHAVLRSCFRQEGERWIQFYQEVNARLYWEGHDLTHLSSSMVSHEVETVCIQAQSSFNLTSGPLFKLVVFRLPEGKPDRLALLAHHLVIDALSVSILLDEIARILEDEKSLPAPTVPYPVYVEKLTQQVHSEAMRAECEFWKQIVEEWKGHSVKLPVDREQGDATEKTSALVSIELDEAQTAVLTRAVPEQTGMSLAELVLAGWASCLAHWQGCPRIMVDMVNHGRSVLPDLDVSRTVGWFGQGGTYPLQVDSLPLTQHWREIKAQIQRVPHHGLGLSWIKTLHDDTGIRECLSLLPEAECSLNYLGNAGQMSASSHALIHDAMGALCDPDNPRRYRHQLLVSIRHARLILQWNYSQARYRTETIEQQMALLKKRLLEWVEEVSNTELMGSGSSRSSEHAFESALSALTPPLSPSLPSASIAPVASTVVTGVLSVPRISPSQSEEQYGLTPLQREIWVRYTDQTTPVSNVIQILAEYEGLYDDTGGQQGLSYETSSQPMVKGITRSLLEWVWNTLVARHPVFRTVFVETDVGTGAHAGGVSQVVLKEAALSMIEKDMTHLAPAEQAEALQALLDSDRHERYDLSRAPAMRLYWVNLCRKTGRVAILQSNHQILLDGWSSMLVMKDFVGCLIARLHGSTPAELSSECRFGNYLNWLEAQDTSGCLGYWKQRFEGYSHQDPLRELIQHRPSGGYATQETYLDSGRMEKIKQTARATQTTSNAVFQAAWVMMLAKIGQLHDLVYGVTVSGRASQCDGIDSIVGQCTNSLPVRMTLETAMRVSDLIQKVHAANHDAQAHNVVSLGDIEQALGMSGGLGRLYSSNIIFESLPSLEAEIPEGMALIKVLNSHWTDSWHFPLRLFVVPDKTTWIRLAYDPCQIQEEDIQKLMALYCTCLEQSSESLDETVLVTLRRID